MSRIRVAVTIAQPPKAVWAHLEDIPSHVGWMADAAEIRFLTSRRSGVGTRFECDTVVGPLRLTDVMEITRWKPGRAMRVRHQGVVTGEGEFRLRKGRRGSTRLTWTEQLRFPWWMGGPLGSIAGAVPLRLIWRGNLRRLKRQIEGA